MATVVKHLGSELPAMEILFFRSLIGFLFVLPLFSRNPLEPFRTKRPGMHLLRGAVGAVGNACFFWTITHMLLADAMALQFSRPLFMIPLAVLLLGEIVGLAPHDGGARSALSASCSMRARSRAVSSPDAFVGALGALAGGLVVICIKRLATTEPTRVIMFYYAFWNALVRAHPGGLFWVTPTPAAARAAHRASAFSASAGQSLITHGLTMGEATVLVPLDYSRIVYSAVLGYLLFSEMPGPWSFAGMALIVACSLYLVLTEKKRRQTRWTPELLTKPLRLRASITAWP